MKTNIYNQEIQDVKKIIDKILEGENSENTRNKIFIAWGKITANEDLSNADTYYELLKQFEQYVIENY